MRPEPTERRGYRSDRARRVERSARALLIAGAPIALAALAMFAAFVLGNETTHILGFLALPLVGLGLVGLGSTYARRAYVDLEGDVVTVDDGVLCVDGREVVGKDEIEQAFVLPHDGAVWVEIERRGRSAVTIRVDDDADGRALLSALGFDATQATASFRALPGFTTWPQGKQAAAVLAPIFGMLVPSVIFFAGTQGWLSAAMVVPFLLSLVLFGMLFRSSKVRIGADGLRHRWLGNERFYAWHEVESVERWVAPTNMKPYVGLALTLKDGEQVVIGAGQEGWNAEGTDQLIVRAQQAWEAHRQSSQSEHVPALERGGRDGRAWVDHLRAVGAGGAAHQRDNFVAPEALLRVVEDGAQPAVARASALVAARDRLSADEVARVRIVANTTVDDPLRVAIDRALDPTTDERALAEALLALEPEARQKA